MNNQAKTQRGRMINGQMRVVLAGSDAGEVRKSSEGAGHMKAPHAVEWGLDIRLSDSVGVSTSVRPGRGRNRTKTELDEKIKKPAEDGRKKSPPARKAPARGRYVDEYARPAG